MTSSAMQSRKNNCREIQQGFYENLGDREYDCFQSSEENYLKLKIGFTLFGLPKNEESRSNLNEDYTVVQCYNKDENIAINKVLKVIKRCSKYNEVPNQIIVSFLFNCCEFPKQKFNDRMEDNIGCYPIFRVKKCTGSPFGKDCCQFIDENLRVYKNIDDYIENNKIPKAKMFIPKDGKYKGDSNNKVLLQEVNSPACSLAEDIKFGADVTTTAASVVSTGIAIGSLIPAITIAPIVLTGALLTGAGIGVYSIVRSSMVLHDRNIHKQSISLANTEARNCYLNIVTGATGVATTGATKVALIAMNRGVIIGETAAAALLSFNAVNMAINGCNVANSLYAVINDITHKRNPSALDIMHLTTTCLFFGNAIINFKSACVIYKETQARPFSEIVKARSANLWAKAKHRFFNADVTTHENNASIKVINNSDDFCQTAIIPNLREHATEACKTALTNLIFKIDLDEALNFGKKLIQNKDNVYALCKIILSRFEYKIQEVLVKLLKYLLQDVVENAFEPLTKLFPSTEKIVIFLNFIINFLKLKLSELEIEYQTKKAGTLREFEMSEEEYDKTCETFKNTGERMLYFLKIAALRMICENGNPVGIFFREMIKFFWDWLFAKVAESSNRRANINSISFPRRKVKCTDCWGYYFVN